MATSVQEQEEQQVRDYLKRAEVKTMKKDLRGLREFDALKERDKIAKLKTTEEQQLEESRKIEAKKQEALQGAEKQKREEVLGRNTVKEREAEKDLKKYADESEKQQIFLLESERVNLQDQIKEFEAKEEPELTLQKNQAILQQKKTEEKLNAILEEEKKREAEEKFIEEKEGQSTIPSEKKALEERRSELEEQREEIEKKRWVVEKELAIITDTIRNIDLSSQNILTEKNVLQSKIKEIDASLRAIYSGVIAKEEEKRSGQEAGQKLRREELSKAGAERKEQIQREQWLGIPPPVKKRPFASEEEQRKQFLENINNSFKDEQQKTPGT